MRTGAIAVALLSLAVAGLAQRFGGIRFQGHDEGPAPVFPKEGEFHFIRTEYIDLPQFHRGFGFGSRNGQGEGWWVVDWPDADDHFSQGIERLTRVNTGEPQPYGTQPAWRAMNDDRGRMIVSVNYNTDIGDAWEYADAPEYPEHMTALAYRYGINYVVYAMTH